MSEWSPPEIHRHPAGVALETERLVLARPIRADAESLALLADDAEIAANLSILPHPYGLDDALAFIDNTEVGPTRWNLGIYLKDEGRAFVGTVSLMPRDGERFVLGYWVGRPWWGRGLASEAAAAIADFAFRELGADRLVATARVTNVASHRVLEKCGFRHAGEGMGPSLFHRAMVPIGRFRLERADWAAKNTREPMAVVA